MAKDLDRLSLVLMRLVAECARDEDMLGVVMQEIDFLLDALGGDDSFGTERQLDPRGDFRVGDWDMSHVQGIDG